MAEAVSARRKNAKSRDSQNGNQIPQKGNQISPVMQIVKASLPQRKAAQYLAFLIDEPLGQCQKLLCGERRENADILVKLLRTDLGREVLFSIMAESDADWFAKYRKQLDINATRLKLQEAQRSVDALQRECI